VKEKPISISNKEKVPLYERIRQILESARSNVARTVNSTQVVANWLIGREIVEEEQKGQKRAGYGEQILEALSAKLTRDFGMGYSEQNLRFIRQLYLTYPLLLGDPKIRYAVRSESLTNTEIAQKRVSNAVRVKLSVLSAPPFLEIGHAVRSESWHPGQLHPNLPWTHL